MSSEFSCDYCTNNPRNPCYSRKEASTCPNASDRGMYLDMNSEDVAAWIRSQARFSSGSTELEAAAAAVERYL